MVRHKRVGPTLALALGCAISAQADFAADMPGLPPLPPPVPIQPVAPVSWLAGGWYVRGDIGYRMPMVNSVEPSTLLPASTDDHFGNGMSVTIGAGIKTQWLRTDFTLDYLTPTKYTGTIVTPDDTTAKIGGFTALFNGYFDLGTWYRLTPYIGGGLGTGYITVSDYAGPAPFATSPDHSEWKFAWAGMAGVGWSIAPNLILDAGYRYLNLGNLSTESNAVGEVKFRNVASHEVRIGLRWSFDDIREYR